METKEVNPYAFDPYGASMSKVLRETGRVGYPARCGKVKRAPTLSEYEEDDNDYYSRDDSHYEEKDR